MAQRNMYHQLELLSRLSAATEELEDIFEHSSKKNKKLRAPGIIRATFQTKLPKKDGANWCLVQAFRDMVLRNLLSGRMVTEAYLSGKRLAHKFKCRRVEDVKTTAAKVGLSIAKLRIRDRHISVELKKSLTGSLVIQAKHPVCHFEAGFLAELCNNATKRNLSFHETHCCAQGSRTCAFVSSDVKSDDQMLARAKAGVLPILPIDQYSDENVRLLTSLASHALNAIENTFLFERTKRQSMVDALTGIYNHRHFQSALKTEIKRAHRFKQPLTLLMMDLDGFKALNDNYGHPRGDKVLKQLARIFVRNVREIDVVARYGGDEFAIILPQTNAQNARIVAARIQASVRQTSFIKAPTKQAAVSVSIGIADNQAVSDEPAALISAADQALLKAKQARAGSTVIFKGKLKSKRLKPSTPSRRRH